METFTNPIDFSLLFFIMKPQRIMNITRMILWSAFIRLKVVTLKNSIVIPWPISFMHLFLLNEYFSQ